MYLIFNHGRKRRQWQIHGFLLRLATQQSQQTAVSFYVSAPLQPQGDSLIDCVG